MAVISKSEQICTKFSIMSPRSIEENVSSVKKSADTYIWEINRDLPWIEQKNL